MEPAESPEPPAPADAGQDKIVVLHVDDEGTFRKLTTDYIQTVAGGDEGTPIEVVSVDSGAAALERIEELDPDCVVSDYAMPGMTGLELIETVTERWPNLPFILLTGKGSEEIASEAVRAGVDDYMQKQSGREQFELLVNRIRSHVSGMQAKESYEELFESAIVGLTVHDSDSGAFLSANQRACELVGASEDELRETTLPEVLAEDESATLEDAKALLAEVAGGASQTVEWHIGEGEELTCMELVLQPAEILGEHRIVASIFDITSAKQHERALEEERTRFRRLVEQVDEYAIFMLDPDGNVTSWNAGAEKIKGYTEEEILGEHVSVFHPAEDVEKGKADQLLARAVEEGTVQEEAWRLRKDGSRFWANVSITALTDEDGELTGFTKVTRDLTDQLERQRDLEEAESFFENATDAFWIVEPEGDAFRITRVNPAVGEHTDIDPDELVGKTLEEVFPPEAHDDIIGKYRECVASGESRTYDQTLDVPGLPTHWRTTYVPVVEDGEVVRILGIGRDVTEAEKHKRELEQAHTRFQAIADSVDTALWLAESDPDDPMTSEVVYVSPKLADMLGADPDAVEADVTQTWIEHVHPDDRERALAEIQDESTGPEFDVDYRIVRDDGTVRWLNTRATVADSGDPDTQLLAGFTQDITEDRERELELEQSRQRFQAIAEAVGQSVWVIKPGDSPPETSDFAYVSPGSFAAFDIDPEGDDTLAEWFALIHPDDQERVIEALEISKDPDADFDVDYRVRVGGTYRWFQSRGSWLDDGASDMLAGVTREVTDLKEREHQLEAADAVFENAPDIMFLFDVEGEDTFRVHRVNPAFAANTAFEVDELPGKTLVEALGEDVAEQVVDNFHRAVATAEVQTYDETIDRPGMPPHWRTTIIPVLDDGEVVRVLGIGRNVTELKEREQKLRAATDRLRTICEASPEPVLVVDASGEVQLWNPAAERTFGWTNEEVLGRRPPTVPDDLRHEFEEGRQRVLDGETIIGLETQRVRKDGTRIDVNVSVAPLRDADGEVTGEVAIIQDVSEKKQHEQELERANARFEAIAESIDAAVWLAESDPDDTMSSQVVYVSPKLADLLGAEPGSVQDDPTQAWIDHLHPDDRDRVLATVQDESTGPEFDVEYRVVRDDGTVRWLTTRASLVGDEGEVQLLAGITQDITEDKERELLYREASLAFEHADEAMWILDATDPDELRYLRVNPAWAEATGTDVDEAEGKTVTEALGEEIADEFLSNYRRCVETGEVQNYEEELDIPGAPTHWRTTLAPVIEDGEVVRVVGIARNVTETKMHEAELKYQNERLAKFASVVSHDLRNPLTVAQGNAELLEGEVEDEEKLEAILESLARAAEIIEDTLTWARTGQAVDETETTELAELAQKAWDGVETEDARLVVEAEATIECDASLLQQMLENLFVNAVQHAGSDVTVTVGDLDDGFYVEDDGPGIPAENRGEVFEGGYTTSEEGLGFGLSIVNQIAKAHDWRIDIVDAEGGGARFEIRTDGGRLPV